VPQRPHALVALAALLALLGACRGQGDGRVVVAYPSAPLSLEPQAASEEFSAWLLRNVFEALVAFDPGVGLRPQLAESWHTPDETTWVFRLRDDVRLHDGRPLRAEHVLRSLERARSDPASRRQGELVAVRTLEAPDARTVVVRTHRPFSALPGRLADVPVWAEAAGGGGAAVGTGPYRIRDWQPGRSTLLEAFPAHRNGPAAVRLLELRAVPDPRRRLQLLEGGGVHLVVDVPAADMAALAARRDIRTATRRGLRVVFLVMNCQRGPFADVRVRRAAALAVDREAIVAGPLEGQADVVDQVVAPEIFGAAPSLFTRPHDPEGARRLLAEAGRAEGFAMTLDYPAGKYRGIAGVAASVARDLGSVGIRVTPRSLEPGAFLERVEAGRSSFYVMGWISTSGDAGLSYEHLLHSPGGGYGQQNGGRYSNAEVDRLLEQAAALTAPEERRPLLSRVASLVQLEAPLLPLYRQADLYAFSTDLEFEPRDDRAIEGAALRRRKAP
jgi:peptide/nickel transport system substrate-binding protein